MVNRGTTVSIRREMHRPHSQTLSGLVKVSPQLQLRPERIQTNQQPDHPMLLRRHLTIALEAQQQALLCFRDGHLQTKLKPIKLPPSSKGWLFG